MVMHYRAGCCEKLFNFFYEMIIIPLYELHVFNGIHDMLLWMLEIASIHK